MVREKHQITLKKLTCDLLNVLSAGKGDGIA